MENENKPDVESKVSSSKFILKDWIWISIWTIVITVECRSCIAEKETRALIIENVKAVEYDKGWNDGYAAGVMDMNKE